MRVPLKLAWFRFALLAALLAPCLSGQAVQLKVAISLRDRPPGHRTASWKLRRSDLPTSKPIDLPLEVPGLGGVDLPPGVWLVQVDVPGYWHSPRVVTLADREQTLDFALWPVAPITGTFAVPKGDKAPNQVSVRFQSAPSAAGERLPVTEITCPVAEGRWRCQVPAGLVDLRFHVRSYVSEFRWGVLLAAALPHDFGTMALRHGASVIGRVTAAPNFRTKLDNTRVVAERVSAGSDAADRGRASIQSFGAAPNTNGFFIIDGLPPGEYSITAWNGRLSSGSQRVKVIQDRETELLEALRLERARVLELQLDPLLAPDHHPWRVELSKAQIVENHSEVVANGAASETGQWRYTAFAGAEYVAVVTDSAGSRWLREVISPNSPEHLALHVPVIRVKGTIKLGDRPLAARIRFGGEFGSLSVPLKSDIEGAFAGFLPSQPDDTWGEVTVASETPPLKRTLTSVRLRTTSEGLVADLVLPSTYIDGVVVDADGKSLERAIVTLQSADEPMVQVPVERDGTFAFHGLKAGTASLQANAATGDSDRVEVALSENEPSHVTLTIRSSGSVQGRVSSTLGAVSGARVAVVPRDSAPLFVIPVSSQADGRFVAKVPKGTREIDVIVDAPGFSFKMFHMAMPDRPIDIPLDQSGGALVMTVPQFSGADSSRQPFLLHAGALTGAVYVRNARFEKARDGYVTIRLLNVERGSYSVCLATAAEATSFANTPIPPSRCAGGFLAPLGELALSIQNSGK